MPSKRHSSEQIINKLREAEVHLPQGMTFPLCARNWESTSRPTTNGDGNMAVCELIRLSDSRTS